jgi:hypothetical protein
VLEELKSIRDYCKRNNNMIIVQTTMDQEVLDLLAVNGFKYIMPIDANCSESPITEMHEECREMIERATEYVY